MKVIHLWWTANAGSEHTFDYVDALFSRGQSYPTENDGSGGPEPKLPERLRTLPAVRRKNDGAEQPDQLVGLFVDRRAATVSSVLGGLVILLFGYHLGRKQSDDLGFVRPLCIAVWILSDQQRLSLL